VPRRVDNVIVKEQYFMEENNGRARRPWINLQRRIANIHLVAVMQVLVILPRVNQRYVIALGTKLVKKGKNLNLNQAQT